MDHMRPRRPRVRFLYRALATVALIYVALHIALVPAISHWTRHRHGPGQNPSRWGLAFEEDTPRRVLFEPSSEPRVEHESTS